MSILRTYPEADWKTSERAVRLIRRGARLSSFAHSVARIDAQQRDLFLPIISYMRVCVCVFPGRNGRCRPCRKITPDRDLVTIFCRCGGSGALFYLELAVSLLTDGHQNYTSDLIVSSGQLLYNVIGRLCVT